MPLTAGTRLGSYVIDALLGAGGMGEVYRARDTRLQRDVALKILPPSAACNPDRQRRFAQEAIAASALNHPNILCVYDVGVEGDAPYLVSELIEGASLRREMDRGRLTLKRWLDIGVQIADGLSAAHEAGIVHRDVKPDNVMITRDGRVKILDFGLAKTTDGEGDDLVSPSAMTQTAAGLLVGTIPYMSPEQARGSRVDFRSDQFSLGLVLYEMATGIHPFLRESSVQTLSAIIADEPKPIGPLNAACPLPVRWLIERLLAKDPHHRYASTIDLAIDLRTIRDRLAEATTIAAIEPASPRRVWLRRSAVAAMVLAALTIGASLPSTTGDDVRQYKFTPLATDAGYQGAPAWSPDGKTIAYVAEVDGVLQVFTRTRGSSKRARVTNRLFDCHDPFWSPDGRIYFHSAAGLTDGLWRVSAAGGEPEMVLAGAVRAALSPDGTTLVALRDTSGDGVRLTLWFATPPDAEPVQYARAPLPMFTDAVLHYSPDGRKLLMWLMTASVEGTTDRDRSGFWIVSPPESDPRTALPALDGLREPALFSWLPDSRHIVVVRTDGVTPGSHLWLADSASTDIRPLTITNGNEGSPDVSPDGKHVAFTSEATDFDLVFLPLDGSPPRPLLSSTRNELDPAWAPAAREYTFVTDQRGGQEIWLRNEEGNYDGPIVTDNDFDASSRTIALGSLAFAPDGQRLAYQRFASDGGYRIWISSRNGGAPSRLTLDDRYQDAPTWSPDGKWIAFNAGAPEQSLVKVGVGGSALPVVLKDGIVSYSRSQWSPDGDWILCQMPEGLTLVSPDGKRTRTISPDQWMAFVWGRDASQVYGLRQTESGHHLALASIEVATGRERVINPNIGTIPQANQPIRGLSMVRPDLLATSIARVRSDVWLLEGFAAPRSFLDRFWRR